MSTPTPALPWRGATAPPIASTAPAWRSLGARLPYRPRWRKLALVAGLALLALAVVTWVVFWIRPPAPARLVVLSASYDRTLAVPPNPYGKADASQLATLAKPGSWLGTRSRFAGGSPTALARIGLPGLSTAREKCVVVFLAAHGGRDRDGPFFFPENATGEPAERVRFKAVLDQLAALPAAQQKLLIVDATHEPAFADWGLVHNDFAAGVEDLDADIAAIPNLAVWLSSGLDERSWMSPEWGMSSFGHFAMVGLNGGADADANKRVTAGELVAFVTPRVSDWARDHRGARQVPVLLPKAEGEQRVRAMHLVSVDGQPAAPTAPEPFEPPADLGKQWEEYRTLAQGTPPPTAYTPHLWRQYEAWTLRYEQHVLAGDTEGANAARASADEVRRKIEAARTLALAPQTLALQAAVGGQAWKPENTHPLHEGIKAVAGKQPADRAKEWTRVRDAAGDTDANRLLWCRALIEWTAEEPLARLGTARALVPLISDGLAMRPTELNFLAMAAQHLPPASKSELIGQLLKQTLLLRARAERTTAALWHSERDVPAYPFAELVYPWVVQELSVADRERRRAEDLCFATDEASWKQGMEAATRAAASYDRADNVLRPTRDEIGDWHRGASFLPATAEWAARRFTDPADKRFTGRQFAWASAHRAGTPADPTSSVLPLDAQLELRRGDRLELFTALDYEQRQLATETARLLEPKPESAAAPRPRADAVKWWNTADAVLTTPPGRKFEPADRIALVREFRRVSRQLLVTDETRPEPLPDVAPAKTRETAFEAARRRGELLLGRFGDFIHIRTLNEVRPGETGADLRNRLDWFAFRADGRQSLAAFGARCGELFDAATALATKPDGGRAADRWVRIAPAHAAVSDAPIDRVRRERVRGYLAYQAQRTFSDHWYGEGAARYYDLAIQRLASDANALTTAPPDNLFKPYLGAEAPFPVAPKLPARIAVTDEPNPTVRVPFDPHATTGVEGFPVFWTDARTRMPIGTNPSGAILSRILTRPALPQPLTPKAQTEAFQVSGFFRGRVSAASTPVDFYAVPDRAAVHAPLPQTVNLAVRADLNALKRYGFGTGAVAIVLDCTGSMGRDPKDPTSVARYPTAVAALAKLLAELPPGTTVNVWTFGQRAPGAKTTEDTIQEILAPIARPLDAEAFIENVMKQVRDLEPWHESPIVRAVVRAKDRIKDAKVPFKAVVLISDAIDTRAAADPEYGGKNRTVADVLRTEFPPSEVALGVAAFDVNADEQAAQAEFKSAEKLAPRGKFVPVKDVDALIAWLRTGLNPRVRFTLQPLNSDTPPPPTSLMAGTLEHDNWYAGRLAPGAYSLGVFGDPKFSGSLQLSPGDRLLLDLTENQRVLSLKRHWFADSVPAVAKAGAPTDPWRLALLQNWAKAGKLELFTAIDANPFAVDGNRFTQIGDVWFEVTPSVPKPEPVAVRWRLEGGFPAPAWSFSSPGWPLFPGSLAHASPRVSAWWAPEPFPATGEPFKAPESGILGAADRVVSVNGAAVALDSVALEEHEIEVVPGERQKRPCLVVRLTHPDGSPVFARPTGVTPVGRELRFYRGANKVTCLYWWPGLTEADVKTKVTGLEFVVLNDALRAAEKAGRHLTLTAPAPAETSARPEPPTK